MSQKPSKRAPRRHRFSEQEYEQLIREVEQAAKEGITVPTFLRSKGHGPSWFYTIRKRYLKAHPNFDPSKPSTALAVRLEPVDVPKRLKPIRYRDLSARDLHQLVNEYLNLANDSRGPGGKNNQGTLRKTKSQWLKEHGLSHQQIYEMKIRAGLKSRSASRTPRSVRSFPTPVVNGAALVPQEIHTPVSVSLDDAILAMEVKRDQLSSFIDDLKRMQRGHR